MEAWAAGDHFTAKARIFVDLKHIDTEVGETDADRNVERVLPSGSGLIRQARDEICTDVPYSSGLQAKDFAHTIAFGVGAADGGTFAIHERLDAEADAIDAETLGLVQDEISNLSGRGLEGDFSVGGEIKVLMERGEDVAKLSWFEEAGGSTAEVEGVDDPRQAGIEASSGGGSIIDLGTELGNVALNRCRRRNS
jgi:hypothetical protein